MVSHETTFGIIKTDFRHLKDPDLKHFPESVIPVIPTGNPEFYMQGLYDSARIMGGVYEIIAKLEKSNPSRNSLSFDAPCNLIPHSREVFSVTGLSEEQQREFKEGLLEELLK